MRAYERLLHYVSFDTQSDEVSGSSPSTEKQKLLGQALVGEMTDLGFSDARMDKWGYVYGSIPANREGKPVLGLLAHLDTAPAMNGADIKPRVVEHYDGGVITLNRERGVVLDPAEFPHLRNYLGQDLIVTDGTTLLGADDKAGIAEILTAAQRLLSDPAIPHGKIAICFTPDEEIGQGTDHFDVKGFGADFAYTVDGGELGEIEYENFNAASGLVRINGVNIHPGEAKGKMKNALLIAMEFHQMLPPLETPANTSGFEGFFHLGHLEGREELATMDYLIRDHDRSKFEAKKARFAKIAAYLNDKYGAGTVELTVQDSYYNMKTQIEPHLHLIATAQTAMEQAGAAPKVAAIRGGTDGARLSYMGLPCPNLSTGGHNFHGRHEYIPVQSMEKMVEVLLGIIRHYGE